MSNREILFRGFHPCEDGGTTIYAEGKAVKGEWVEGLLLKSFDDNGAHLEIQTWQECSDGATSSLLDIIPSTVGQYAGLRDKNDAKLFEGDRVKTYYANSKKADHIETIKFYEGKFLAVIKSPTGFTGAALPTEAKHLSQDKSVYMTECAVIGTIFDKAD